MRLKCFKTGKCFLEVFLRTFQNAFETTETTYGMCPKVSVTSVQQIIVLQH